MWFAQVTHRLSKYTHRHNIANVAAYLGVAQTTIIPYTFTDPDVQSI